MLYEWLMYAFEILPFTYLIFDEFIVLKTYCNLGAGLAVDLRHSWNKVV